MSARRIAAYVWALLLASSIGAAARDLPARIAPPAPFPQILSEAPTLADIAPGVTEADYEIRTKEGPVSIRVVAIQPHRSDLHVGTVLAADRLTSPGETVSSMARRTGAVAGVNGDYFDIDSTNRPTNVLVRDGRLLRTPRHRYAIAIGTDGRARFAEFSFEGSLTVGDATAPLDAVNEYPPPAGGTALLTPDFGDVAPQTNETLVSLEPVDGTPPFGRYRVTGIADNGTTRPAGYYLAIGPSAYGTLGVPNADDVVTASGDFASGDLGSIVTAVGGGPLILHDGAWYDDPDGPSFQTRIPSTGAAVAPDGTLFLIEVDGRQPEISIGLTRPQFAALMAALGATEGMALDGGGSSTIVARNLGDDAASLQNSPSDGRERPVADGIFVYSDAPVGPPARIVVRPGTIRAMPGATVPIAPAVVDAADHARPAPGTIRARVVPSSLGTYVGGAFVARSPGSGTLYLASGALRGSAPVAVTDRPARLEIVPARTNLAAGAHIRFAVRALDRDGFAIALPPHLHWSATGGSIAQNGSYVASRADATVSVRVGKARAGERVTVGTHDVPLSLAAATFVTSPRNGPGSLAVATPCPVCLTLAFDFTGSERAAYAKIGAPLPDGALGVRLDVDGDGSGTLLRVAFVNAIDERVLLTAGKLDFTGSRSIAVALPPGFAGPGTLSEIYVLDGIGKQRADVAGRVVIRGASAILPGTAAPQR